MRQKIGKSDLAALLAWMGEMGVDAALGEKPVDWLAREGAVPGAALRSALRDQIEGAPQLRQGAARAGQEAAPLTRDAPLRNDAAGTKPDKPSIAPQTARQHGSTGFAGAARRFPTAAPLEAVTGARDSARKARSLVELCDILQAFDGCALKATAKNLCFYRGAPQAPVMIIGEAPGREEDIAGKPFVGRAGQLLDKMLSAIDLDENSVHITNVVYWRPPGNRTPSPHEAQICRPFLERQIELVAPAVILLLGGAAAKTMLEVSDGIMRLRGKWRELLIGGEKFRTIATLHPAYLLRTPIAKRLAWRDLQKLRAALKD